MMDDSKYHTDEIPLLLDFATKKSDKGQETKAKENPFLPYEHLARLALEREQFTQNLEKFTENLKREKPYSQRVIQNTSPLHNENSALINAITQKVIDELIPIIKKQVNKELSQHLELNSTDS